MPSDRHGVGRTACVSSFLGGRFGARPDSRTYALLLSETKGSRSSRLNPTPWLADERRAVALLDLDATVTRSGRRISERDEVHIWHFDAAGKVIRFRHAVDTLQHYRAFNGQDS